MRAIGWIALNAFRESVRDKVLYNLVLFAVLMIGASYLIGQLTAGQDIKIIKDVGLSAIAVFGLFIAVFVGINLVSKEVERKSIYALLSKPVERYQLVLGKYAGVILTLAVNVTVMVVAFYAVLAYMRWMATPSVLAALDGPALDPRMLKAVVLLFAELAVVTAAALFFSSFSTPMLSATFTVAVYVAGHFSGDLKHFDQVVDSRAVMWITSALYWILPNLASFDVKAQVVHAQPVARTYVALTLAYGAAYIAVLLSGAVLIFSRRDFK